MAELRSSSDLAVGQSGVFATRDFQVGDVILAEESPVWTLAPIDAQERVSILSQLIGCHAKKEQVLDALPSPPSKIASVGKWKGMLLAAATFSFHCGAPAKINSDDALEARRSKLMQFYQPSLDESSSLSHEEKEAVDLARSVLQWCQHDRHVVPESSLGKWASSGSDDEVLVHVMLVWAFNAFEGGRMYEMACRVNHNCDPNAISVVDDMTGNKERMFFKALAPIRAGQEITQSYLGLAIYADRAVRRQRMRQFKHFVCVCQRCLSDPDLAHSIPCPSCHVRSHGGMLEEDIQYDDDKTVHYSIPTPNKQGSDITFRCGTCATVGVPNREQMLLTKVSDKVADRVFSFSNNENITINDTNVQEAVDQQLFQLSSSILGARHWTTNLMLVQLLDRQLATLHTKLLLQDQDQMEDVDWETEVAEAIDSLERIWVFVDGLKLQLHPGHLLSSQVIGVARTLIATFSDEKSQKYASEHWISRIVDHAKRFEPEAVNKVIEALSVSWQRHDNSNNTAEMPSTVGALNTEDEDMEQTTKKRAKKM